MSSTDSSNHLFQLASRFVNQTGRHIFLTGRAGTGKTTFLRYIREHSAKKMAIVAPTGVAAINAGGVTLHSFFQLPFGAFIPTLQGAWDHGRQVNNPHTLLKNLRLSNDKRELMRELELLIIDEVSMLRADLLDEIDLVLRHVRHKTSQPFGGVQVLFIGDLFQLPPVINNEEWELLRPHYRSPLFFDAQVLQQSPLLYLELQKIYRQHETGFINLLNNVRNNQVTDQDLELLHKHYRPGYQQEEGDNYITLTTHNAKADAINQQQLEQLEGEQFAFTGEIKGDFSEKALPADKLLQLKVGAQIMFLKNDKGESRRYYNGKIAIVDRIENDKIFVRFPNEPQEMELEKETWRNIRYQYNREQDNIEEEELGTYTQYPIRLAWAITIHKSQGLTFEKAIIDAGASFAPGQVYVALSRLTTLDGLILFSRIQPHAIQTDERALHFTRSARPEDFLLEELQKEQKLFIGRSLVQSFDWSKLFASFRDHFESYERLQLPDKNAAVQWAYQLLEEVTRLQEMAGKFNRQLEQLLPQAEQDNYQHLHQRIGAAVDYFGKPLDVIATSIQTHTSELTGKQKSKKYLAALRELALLPDRKKLELQACLLITEGLTRQEEIGQLLQQVEEKKIAGRQQQEKLPPPKPEKAAKGETRRLSLQLFREGKGMADIAIERNLAISTIETHLVSFIITGEISITDIVDAGKVTQILQAMEAIAFTGHAAQSLKDKLGENFSYGEIRAVIQHRDWLQTASKPQE
ncbi:MAG: AAA family ATPase [Candidatus Pseudobacter hemicellulosilyticus]|uniref:AAA family ATPase n=1 Tax=Candidatus Pseudobacter hemicellulosilyticus TaxID=3121375 RepID=A0AAJ5WUH1_9BACT|nr:MAG: AAA family ATPase [Pseudobacter sp.]